MDYLPPGLLDNLGTVAVTFLFGWLVVSGRLVPRRTYEDLLHDRNEWRTEVRVRDVHIETKNEQIAEKDKQLAHLAEVGHTVEAMAAAVQAEREVRRREEAP